MALVPGTFDIADLLANAASVWLAWVALTREGNDTP
jgi:hypothetical protein